MGYRDRMIQQGKMEDGNTDNSAGEQQQRFSLLSVEIGFWRATSALRALRGPASILESGMKKTQRKNTSSRPR